MTAAAVSPAVVYGRLLAALASAPRRAAPGDARLRVADGGVEPLRLDRWIGPCTAADHAVLDRIDGPVLDVGCGPGRFVAALARRGVGALGIDLTPEAVALTRRRGGRALRGCVFEHVPHAGSWRTALLLDGNIGIGGDPAALLRRVASLLAPGGEAVVEVGAAGTPTRRLRVRLEVGGEISDWFPWATVGADVLSAVARDAGLRVEDRFTVTGRTFARLG